jgi:hypothetical protein
MTGKISSDPVQLLIDAGAIPKTPFAPDSRYSGVAIGRYVRGPNDPGVVYLLRRFIPQMRDIPIFGEHLVKSGERPDGLAAQAYADAELYWRIADGNAVIDPFALTDTMGGRIKIPFPPGS